ncbi:MAG TPA: hypothetical protein VGC38_04455 [Pseudolabrys sp.]
MMRSHIVAGLFASILISGAVLWSATGQAPAQANAIDFTSLHDQANLALRMLQTAQERRVASTSAGQSAF